MSPYSCLAPAVFKKMYELIELNKETNMASLKETQAKKLVIYSKQIPKFHQQTAG
jgi:hypothetical protein